jgi:hypothetical protein
MLASNIYAGIYYHDLLSFAAMKKGPGRPAAGLRQGELSSQYRRLTVRVPDRTFRVLAKLTERTGLPQWRVILDALVAYESSGANTRRKDAE